MLDNADEEIDFSVVDLIMVVTPRAFGDTCGFDGTQIDDINKTLDGVDLERVITSDYRNNLPFFTSVFAHEYGHVMGLPELFDRTHHTNSDSVAHSGGIGHWGVMGHPNWPHVEEVSSGANLLSAFSRTQVEWIAEANERLETIESDRLNIPIYDINSTEAGKAGKVYKIPVNNSDKEYFLVSNRQNKHSNPEKSIGSYYEDLATGEGGLAIWHIDERAQGRRSDANEYERHKRVDLECADGLFADKGYPGGTRPNSVSGGDNLDYWSDDSTYAATNHGNWADATDLWDGDGYTTFTPESNPSTAGYEAGGNSATKQQDVFSGIYIENIRQGNTYDDDGKMRFDVRFAPLAPRSLTKVVGEQRVSLSWQAPLPNGAQIDGFGIGIAATEKPHGPIGSKPIPIAVRG